MSGQSGWSGARYATVGVMETITMEVQYTLWSMVDLLRQHADIPMDYLQIFELSPSPDPSDSLNQTIVHSQEEPPYKATNSMHVDKPVTAKIFVVFEADYATMMLASEY